MTDTINTHVEQSEPQEQVDAMVAKGEQIEANNQGDERPEWLPEKFKTPEDMASAYQNLEKKLGGGQQEEETVSQNEQSKESETNEQPSGSEVQKAVEAAGVDFNSLQNEYSEHGELSEDAYAKLADAGFPQDLVNSWIKGQEALAGDYQSSVQNIVGGADAYNEMITWASDNLSETEIAAYDRAVGSGDLDMVKLAVSGLQSKYQTAEGSDPALIAGQSVSSSGGNYSSWAEVTTAMRDPRYARDPAYRQSVADKLGRSNIQ